MYSIRTLFVVIAVVALIAAMFAYQRQQSLIQKLRGQVKEKKSITNEYFIKDVVQNTDLIGASTKTFSDIPIGADYIFGKGNISLEHVPSHRLTLRTPGSRELGLFKEMFDDDGGYLTPKFSASDTVYWYTSRPSGAGFGEGQYHIGYFVFCRNDVIVAIADGICFVPN